MASLKKSLNDYLKDSKSKNSKGGDTNRDKALQSFFGGSDIFSTFIRSKFKSKKQPGEKSAEGDDKKGEDSAISQDSLVFLKIIAKNSIALPGMARDVNVLRQNVVKLVKLKTNDKKGAATKADKFFKTEDQRESELEGSRKKQETKVNLVKDKTPGGKEKKKPSAGKEDDDSAIISWLWDNAKTIAKLIFWGIIAAVGTALTIGSSIAKWFEENFNPMEWINSLFKSITEGWKAITETDIVKETLIKGIGKLLDFITFGLFGEKQLRENLKSLSDDLQPIITFFTEMFDRVANWMSENIGWDKFTIPLSKFGFDMPLPDTLVAAAAKLGINLSDKISVSFPDITVPGFRPFSKRERIKPGTSKSGGGGATSTPAATINPATDTGETTSPAQVTQSESADNTSTSPRKESAPTTVQTKEDAVKILDAFGAKPDAQSPTGFSTKNGTPIEEPLLRSALIAQGVDADKIINLVKPSSSSPKSEAASPITNNMDIKLPSDQSSGTTASGGGGASGITASSSTPGAGGENGSMSPSPDNSAEAITPNSSGSQLGKISSDVAEGQRLDSAPDAGNVVNASTTNNNKGSVGKDSTKIADAYNNDFIEKYLQPAI